MKSHLDRRLAAPPLRGTDWSVGVDRELKRKAELEYYRRADFLVDPHLGVYLPPDPPRPYRWQNDPAVIGGLIGAIIVLAAVLIWGGA